MLCNFVKIKENTFQCTKCKEIVIIKNDLPIYKNCNIKRYCVHKSLEPIHTEQCDTCSGNIQIKVFTCSIHKECCLSDKLQTAKNCNICEDFESTDS